MKRTLGLILLLFTLSCSDDVTPIYEIYNEWKWVKTTFDTRGRPITAQDVDSTYYYSFTKDGKLITKDNDKRIISEFNIVVEIIDDVKTYRIQGSDAVFGYGIKSDTLYVWQANSIWPRTDIYKISK